MVCETGGSLPESVSSHLPNICILNSPILDQNELRNTAVKWFGEVLQLNPQDAQRLLADRVQLQQCEEGKMLSEQGTAENAELILVLQGSLRVTQDAEDEENDNTSFITLIQPKELVGGLQVRAILTILK